MREDCLRERRTGERSEGLPEGAKDWSKLTNEMDFHRARDILRERPHDSLDFLKERQTDWGWLILLPRWGSPLLYLKTDLEFVLRSPPSLHLRWCSRSTFCFRALLSLGPHLQRSQQTLHKTIGRPRLIKESKGCFEGAKDWSKNSQLNPERPKDCLRERRTGQMSAGLVKIHIWKRPPPEHRSKILHEVGKDWSKERGTAKD